MCNTSYISFKKEVGVFLVLALLMLHLNVWGQIFSYTKSDGLTSSVITCTLADRKGVVWLGTNNGLNAFASGKWYTITSIENNKTGKAVPIGRVEAIYEDSHGQIWVSITDKIILYNHQYWTVFSESDIEGYAARYFYEDHRGWIWAAMEYYQDFSNVSEIPFNLSNGTLHMYNGVSWFKFDEDVAGTVSVNPGERSPYFTPIVQDADENIWVGTLKGVFMFDGKEWTKYDKKELVSEKIRDLRIGKDGTVWAGTDYGISYLKNGQWNELTRKQGLPGTDVYELLENPKGNMWAFTRNNMHFAGISLIKEGKSMSFDKHKLRLKGSVENLIWYDSLVLAMARDGVSVYDDGGKWYKYNDKSGLHDHKFYFLIKDKWERIWLAGNRSVYLLKNNTWEQLKEPEEWKVSVLMVSRRGDVWVGTEKNGVYRYSNNNWTHFTTENGLSEGPVTEIFEDIKGYIWIITKKGASRIEDA